jgi:hypothetical protein
MEISKDFGRESGLKIDGMDIRVYTVPTDSPEADGTFRWDSTTMVYAELYAGKTKGIGYSYADMPTAVFIN